jgi:hypothetical protein
MTSFEARPLFWSFFEERVSYCNSADAEEDCGCEEMIFDWKYDDAMLMLQNVEMQLFSLLDVDYQIIIVSILVQSMA